MPSSQHPIPSAARRISPSFLPPAAQASLASHSSDPAHVQPTTVPLTYSAPPAQPAAQAVPSQSLTTQLSDLLLSAVVPGIPKSTSSSATPINRPDVLSSRREELNLTSTTNNFRTFVLKVGVIFWLQDRVEEVFTWRRKSWSVCFAIAWGLISFYPHLLLMAPSVILLSALLNPLATSNTVGVARPTQAALVSRSPEREKSPVKKASEWEGRLVGSGGSHGRSMSVAGLEGSKRREGSISEGNERRNSQVGSGSPIPTTQGGSPESLSTTYYSNIQGIQNLMGLFSDMHDLLTPALTRLISPTFPLHNTLIAANALLLVGVTLGGRWVPVWCWLLPVGWGPLVAGALPSSFWTSTFFTLQPSPSLVAPLEKTYLTLLDDQLPPEVWPLERKEVSVWETQRWGALEGGGEGWGKSRWEGREVGSLIAPNGIEVEKLEGVQPSEPWSWVQGESWSIDHVGRSWIPTFSRLTLDGWAYLDESHGVLTSAQVGEGKVEGGMRRRRWWRRAVRAE